LKGKDVDVSLAKPEEEGEGKVGPGGKKRGGNREVRLVEPERQV